jgi:hypothetical protein
MGIDTMYHAIHAFGLAELLKTGVIANVDDEHFWNLIDNTYIDDVSKYHLEHNNKCSCAQVNEAMLAGRKSVYDNDFYLSTTYPPPSSSNIIVLSASQRASMAIMHVLVQCPRLSCLVRHAIAHPDDTTAIVSAITLTESLWQLDLSDQVSPLLSEAVTLSTRPVRGLTDIFTNSLHFTSVQSMILCTRYWMLITLLGGLVDTLYRYFPTETALSLLPDRYIMHKLETDAAMQLARSIPWADSLSQKLPLVPLRLHTPLQISLGPWHRTIQRLNCVRFSSPGLDANIDLEMTRTIAHAQRMESWIIEECNRIHRQWDVSVVAEKPLYEILNTMAGEKIPDWLPIRVRFEAEDGEMLLKLDYENKTGSYQEHFDVGQEPAIRVGKRHAATAWVKEAGLVYYTSEDVKDGRLDDEISQGKFIGAYRSKSMEPRDAADFVHSTGRNLCSTSGWWPSTEDSSTVLLDSTHKASAFSQLDTIMSTRIELPDEHVDRHPCLASSFWPQASNSTTASLSGTSRSSCLSPAWSSTVSQIATTFDNREKSARFSAAWTSPELETPSSLDSLDILD